MDPFLVLEFAWHGRARLVFRLVYRQVSMQRFDAGPRPLPLRIRFLEKEVLDIVVHA